MPRRARAIEIQVSVRVHKRKADKEPTKTQLSGWVKEWAMYGPRSLPRNVKVAAISWHKGKHEGTRTDPAGVEEARLRLRGVLLSARHGISRTDI